MAEKQRTGTNYILFMIVLLLYFIPKYIEYTTFYKINGVGTVVKVAKNMAYICAIMLFIIKTVRKRTIKVIPATALFLFLVYFTYQAMVKDNNSLFVVILLSLNFEEQYLKKYVRHILIVSIFLYVLTVIACKLGFIENVVTSRHKFGKIWTAGGNGFIYSGQMIMMLIPLVFLYYYMRDGKITWRDNVLWVVITAFIYFQCQTIMGAVLIIMFIVLYNLFCGKNHIPKKGLIKSKIITYIPIISCIISILFVWLYKIGNKVAAYLDIVVNGRLSVSQRVIDRYGIKLWGTSFRNNALNGKYEILDSEYMQMLVIGGVIFLVVALVLCVFYIKWAQRKKDYCLILIWTMVFINAIVNNGIYGVVMNPFCILIVPAIKETMKKTRKMIVDGRETLHTK